MQDRFNTFTMQIAKISRNIRKIKTEEMSEFNLKSTHVSCLYYLYKNNGTLTAKEISDLCDEDKAAVSRSLDYLEANGYITCDSKLEKRYKSPLVLTEKGKQIGEKVIQKIDGILDISSVGLSESERENFYSALILISDNLQKISNKYGEK